MNGQKPSNLAAVLAILKISFRRSINRPLTKWQARRGRAKGIKRQATAPRRSGWAWLSVVLYGGLLVMAFFGAGGYVGHVCGLAGHPGRIGISSLTYDMLLTQEKYQELMAGRIAESGPATGPAREPGISVTQTEHGLVISGPASQPFSLLGDPLRMEARMQAMGRGNEQEIERRLADQYARRGLDGFYQRSPFIFWPDESLGADAPNQTAILTALSAPLLLLTVMLVIYGWSQYGRDLVAAHWSTEWYFSFPVRARAIFLADVIQASVLNFMAWISVFPLLTVVLFAAGYGWWAPLAAAGGTLFLSILAASVCMFGETWMRRSLGPAKLRSIQATCTVLTTMGLAGLMIGMVNPRFAEPVAAFTSRAVNWPRWVLFLPPAWPLLLTESLAWAGTGVLAMAGLSALAAIGATRISERLVRTGLIVQTGMTVRKAARQVELNTRPPLLRGVVGREVRLLLRDRTLLANTVIMPIFFTLLQMFIQQQALHAAWGDPRHLAAMAFGIGCYVILLGGIQVIVSEGRSLWLLYTFPRGLEWVLLRKVALWACFAILLAMGILGFGLRSAQGRSLVALLPCLLAIWGVGVFAFINCGIGVLTFHMPQGNERARVPPTTAYLCMMLAGLYAGAIYAKDVWHPLVTAVLYALVAAAIWQLVRDRIAYLLDPMSKPPPVLSVAHGLLTAFAFFAAQGVILVVLLTGGFELSVSLSVSYVLAGVIVAVAALGALRGVPNLWRLVGLRSTPERSLPALPALATGVGLGVLTAVMGTGYLLLCRQFPALWQQTQESTGLAWEGVSRLLLVGLIVVAAPLVEELIFRGLLLRGLERMGRPALAVLGSAAIFAVIHPPISIVPVFVLGLAAAIGFRKTGLLWTPITTHATYNGLILLAGYWLGGPLRV